jgi:hypothetical protein
MPSMLQLVTGLTLGSSGCLIFGYLGRLACLRTRSGRQARLDWISQKKEITSKKVLVWFCVFVTLLSVVLSVDFIYRAKADDALIVSELCAGAAGLLGGCAAFVADYKDKQEEIKVHKTWTFRFMLFIGLALAALLVAHLLHLGDNRVFGLISIMLVIGASTALVCKKPWQSEYRSPFEWVTQLGLLLLTALVVLTVFLTIKHLIS